jgi:CRP-like cAMP-binding protein
MQIERVASLGRTRAVSRGEVLVDQGDRAIPFFAVISGELEAVRPQDAAHLSEVRFKAGTTDYIEVLTNNTNAFSAELTLAQAQGNELTALVQLYQALGGGWQQ